MILYITIIIISSILLICNRKKIQDLEIYRAFKLPLINKTVKGQFEQWEIDSAYDDIKLLSIKQLEGYLEQEKERAKYLDEKLHKFTAVLSVAVAIAGTYANNVINHSSHIHIALLIIELSFLILSITLFLFGIIYGFYGLETKTQFAYGARYLSLTSNDNTAKKEMTQAACGFQMINTIRANYVSAATTFIKYGILLFSLTVVLNIIISVVIKSPQPPLIHIIKLYST